MSEKSKTKATAHPFLKYAGGKRQLAAEILSCIPASFGRYHEPFVGGGAVFWALCEAQALGARSSTRGARIGDSNAKLVTAYTALRDCPQEVISRLRMYENTKEHYLEVRARNFERGGLAERAADLLFVNRTCFNGLYRENKKGRFNVPYGDNPRATICDEENLLAVSAALQGVEIRCGDFADLVGDAVRGDVCYMDPPYVPISRCSKDSKTSSFVAYQADGFTWQDHVRLRDVAVELRARGVTVILSNSSCPETRELYAGWDVRTVKTRRAINSKAAGRGAIDELLILGGVS